MIKLVLFGHTGSGKSTSASIVRRFFENRGKHVVVLKLAQPLYELQHQFYRITDRSIELYQQDQILLEMIANQLRRISPSCLIDNFQKRLLEVEADVILNDDLRDPYVDFPALKKQGFRFIRITCSEEVRLQRLRLRDDLSTNVHSTSSSQIDLIEADVMIDNSGNQNEELEAKLFTVLEGWL